MHYYRCDAKTTESYSNLNFSELWAEYVLFQRRVLGQGDEPPPL